MADTSKNFIYLLPDVAYIVELVKAKDSEVFKISDYLQVDGNFMNDNEILEESVKKLSGRIQAKEYELVLPDFLFTNTVVNVDQTGEEAVSKYVMDELVPSLGISVESHDIEAFVLTELKGSAKAQLSALEKSLLEPLTKHFKAGGPTVNSVYPLSWTLKSLISLEPSISVVQLGAHLYLAQHYIGVDQAINAELEDAEKLVETIKTLKGAEPSIQTLYLLSNAVVEEKLKDGLKETLPLQQLADDGEESEMPSYVKQAIEAGAKTVSVADYTIPVFTIGKAAAAPATAAPAPAKETMAKEEQSATNEAELPTPTEVGGEAEESAEQELQFADVPETAAPAAAAEVSEPEEVDLSQFSDQEKAVEEEPAPAPAAPAVKKSATADKEPAKEETMETPETTPVQPAKKVIKNDAGTNSMVRMIFIGLVSFFVTVGIGLGIGLGLLSFTQSGDEAPVEQTAEVTPTPEATPTPTPTPVIERAEYSVLVVNATTQAGYAGEIADALEEAGFESVDAANARGDYEEGNYILMAEEDQGLIDLLSEDSGLDLVYSEDKAVEVAAEEYDIVIVLAE